MNESRDLLTSWTTVRVPVTGVPVIFGLPFWYTYESFIDGNVLSFLIPVTLNFQPLRPTEILHLLKCLLLSSVNLVPKLSVFSFLCVHPGVSTRYHNEITMR